MLIMHSSYLRIISDGIDYVKFNFIVAWVENICNLIITSSELLYLGKCSLELGAFSQIH